jgi:hypothetical protein
LKANFVVVEIELCTVAFYRGEAPSEIALRDCSFPMRRAPAAAFSALYGEQGKQNGFVAARLFAAGQGMQYTVVDLVIQLAAQNPLVMKPDDLASYDFLNFNRMSRSLSAEVSEWFAAAGSRGGRDDSEMTNSITDLSARAAIAVWPLLVDKIAARRACEHLKVIAYQARTLVSPKLLTVGSVPHRHWGSIREATCRLNPKIRIDLTPPDIAYS